MVARAYTSAHIAITLMLMLVFGFLFHFLVYRLLCFRYIRTVVFDDEDDDDGGGGGGELRFVAVQPHTPPSTNVNCISIKK